MDDLRQQRADLRGQLRRRDDGDEDDDDRNHKARDEPRRQFERDPAVLHAVADHAEQHALIAALAALAGAFRHDRNIL